MRQHINAEPTLHKRRGHGKYKDNPCKEKDTQVNSSIGFPICSFLFGASNIFSPPPDRPLVGPACVYSIIFTTLGRSRYAFDIFALPLNHLALSSSSPFPSTSPELRLTDGISVNYNGNFAPSSDALLFVSERNGSHNLYLSPIPKPPTSRREALELEDDSPSPPPTPLLPWSDPAALRDRPTLTRDGSRGLLLLAFNRSSMTRGSARRPALSAASARASPHVHGGLPGADVLPAGRRRRGGRVGRGRMAPALVSLPAGGDSVRRSSVRLRSAESAALIGSAMPPAPLLDSSVSGHTADDSSVSSSAALARRRHEIRMGKRPILSDGDSSMSLSMPLPGSLVPTALSSRPDRPPSGFPPAIFSPVHSGTSSVVLPHLRPPSSPAGLLSVDSAFQAVLIPDVPYVLGPACSLVTGYPTPSVFPLPFAHAKQTLLNRRRRLVLHTFQRKRARVPLHGPPFTEKRIALLKALAPERSYYGAPAYRCERCGALFWFLERCKRSSVGKGRLPVFSRCCLRGKVSLPRFNDWPSPLKELLSLSCGSASTHFYRLIRHYNSLFAFTSMGADIDRTVNSGGAPYIFKMCGSAYHQIGSLLPCETDPPKFAQLYIVDSADEVQKRIDLFGQEDIAEGSCTESADPLIVKELTEMLDQHNHLVEQFRYLSACEACWRMFGYDIQGRQPSVERLVVHLPSMNKIIFHENDPLVSLVDNSLRYKTMLTEWFVANQNHLDARSLTYLDFPTAWVWDAPNRVWNRRVKKRKIASKIGRIYHVHPSCGELFFMRMLLLVVTGATCFEDLRRYDGTLYDTFKHVCQARGLVGDDNEWFNLFEEAIVWATPFQLRHLFMTVLLYCEVINGNTLFDRFWSSMAEDISYKITTSLGGYVAPDVYIQDELLKELSIMFAKNGSSLASFNISPRCLPANRVAYNRLIAEETQYDLEELQVQGEAMRAQLNSGQRIVFSQIMHSVDTQTPKVYFVSGNGGTGKTFLWNCVVTVLRSERRVVLAVASSGVASLLLPNGRTAHSRFRIPIHATDKSHCNISRGSTMASLLEETSLILWDKAPMTSHYCFEALDRTLRDVLSCNDSAKSSLPFGGKTVILGGDFRQVLPVIEGGSRNEIIDASLIASPLWRHVTVLSLKENMRLSRPGLSSADREELSIFSQWILDVGNGDIPGHARDGEDSGSWITIPDDLILRPTSSNVDAAIESVYDSFFFNYSSAEYLADRAIMCPTNIVVDEINDAVFTRVPGCSRRYLSCDSISKSTDHVSDAELLYPPEFLHSVKVNNFPHHQLDLKVGVPVMLLRNINQSLGLCNGTRLLVVRLGERVLEGEIITGSHKGNRVCIPRIVLNSVDSKWPFTLRRC
ncbi:hypothetical protein ACQ4PT_000481 [Festuca glaucescens]